MKHPKAEIKSLINHDLPDEMKEYLHLSSSNVRTKENKEAYLELSARASDPMSTLTVSITGVPLDWEVHVARLRENKAVLNVSKDPATNTVIFQLKQAADFVGGPILRPPQDSDFDADNILISVTEEHPDKGEVETISKKVIVIVDAVVNIPELHVVDAKGKAGDAIPMQIHTAVTDLDGSEEITSILFENIPQGAMLSSGADLSGGRWSVLHKDLDDLTLMVPYAGVYHLNVIATAQEININGFEYDFEDNVASVEEGFTVTVLD